MRRQSMKVRAVCSVCMVLGLSVAVTGGEKKAKPAAKPVGKAVLYDTMAPASQVSDMGKWTRIGDGQAPASFQGDAALVNAGLAVLVRKDGSGADLFAKGAEGWNHRGRLVPAAGGKSLKLGGAKAVAGVEAPSVEAPVQGVEGQSVVFALKNGVLPAVKVTARGPVEALRIVAACRLGILPDFFADDLMIDARKIPVARAEIPSDNFFLHMLAGGDSILAAVWEKNERDLEVALEGEGDRREIASTDVYFGAGGSVWAAVLELKNIWYSRDMTRDEGAKGAKLDWPVPFVAKWKGDFTREDGAVESKLFSSRRGLRGAERLVRKSGSLQAVLGGSRESRFKGYVGLSGVMAAYPISRDDGTPLERLCVDDLLRECLGTQACAYILDVDSRTKTDKGIFTCSYGATFGKIMPAGVARKDRAVALALKEERAFVRTQNEQVLIFITHIQDRINVFVDLFERMLAYLDEQEKKQPDLADFAKRMRELARKKMFMYGGRYQDPIKKADGAKRAEPLLAKVYRALEVDTPEQVRAAFRSVGAIPQSIGDPQDLRVAQLRRRTKELRAMAGLEMAVNPAAAETAKTIRKWTEEALRNPSGYERPITW
jgi:hypothetical protein